MPEGELKAINFITTVNYFHVCVYWLYTSSLNRCCCLEMKNKSEARYCPTSHTRDVIPAATQPEPVPSTPTQCFNPFNRPTSRTPKQRWTTKRVDSPGLRRETLQQGKGRENRKVTHRPRRRERRTDVRGLPEKGRVEVNKRPRRLTNRRATLPFSWTPLSSLNCNSSLYARSKIERDNPNRPTAESQHLPS